MGPIWIICLLCLSLPFTAANYHKLFLASLPERYGTLLNTVNDATQVIDKAFQWPPLDSAGVPVDIFQKFGDNPEVLRSKIHTLLGPPPQPGEFPKEGYVFTMAQAYKIVLYDDAVVDLFRQFARLWRNTETNARNHQRNIEEILWKIYPFLDYCRPLRDNLTVILSRQNLTGGTEFPLLPTLLEGEQLRFNLTATCLNFTEEERDVATTDLSLAHNLLEGYTAAMFLFSYLMVMATDMERVKGFQTRVTDTRRFPVSPFNVMLRDTKDAMEKIGQNMETLEALANNTNNNQEERDFYAEKWRYFDQILRTSPYDQLYNSTWEEMHDLRLSGVRNQSRTVITRASGYMANLYNLRFRDDIRQTYIHEESVGRWNYTSRTYEVLTEQYRNALEVSPKRAGDPGQYGFSWGDDGEVWDFDINIGTHPIQNLRVAWNYLDRVVEEQNCYLRQSYWQDKRRATLEKTQYTRAKVFSQISKTYLMPCKFSDDDIVSRCTAENHEICRPAHMSDYQISHVEDTEDQIFFRPKWVFTRTELQAGNLSTINCTGQLTFVPLVYLCRCGFKDDCGDDLGAQVTCVLQANDMYRKQCKGSIGYPCQTLPFLPGKHDESCMTGYCDRKANSCEEDERWYPDYTGDPRRFLSTNEAGETNQILRFAKAYFPQKKRRNGK